MTDIEKLDEAMARAACARQLGPRAWNSFSDSTRNNWLKSFASYLAALREIERAEWPEKSGTPLTILTLQELARGALK